MERLGDFLKRQSIPRSIPEDHTAPSSGTDAGPGAQNSSDQGGPSPCPFCHGSGFLRRDVPLGHSDFGRAFPCRCTLEELEEHRLERLQRSSNLGALTRLTFEGLLPHGRSTDPAQQERFQRAMRMARAFAEDPQGWLVLLGPSGCGKTHLAASIANHCLSHGYLAFFQVVPDLLDHLRASYSPQSDISYDQLLDRLREVPLLILDDLGTHSSTPWAQEKLFQLLNHRFNAQLPTVVTTNVTLEALEERLRTRLTDPALSQVCTVEEPRESSLGSQGLLALPLLRKMTFENFDVRGMNAAREQRQSLETAHWAARRFAEAPEGWLVLLGAPGCGKTHLAAAIGNHVQAQQRPAEFVVVPDLLDHFRSTYSPESKLSFDTSFERIKNAPLLILDDLGLQTTTPWAQEKLYQLLNHRYNAQLPTVITSASSLKELSERDLGLSSRMLDPMLSNVVPIDAPDYRQGERQPPPPSSARRGSPRRGR